MTAPEITIRWSEAAGAFTAIAEGLSGLDKVRADTLPHMFSTLAYVVPFLLREAGIEPPGGNVMVRLEGEHAVELMGVGDG